MELIVFYFEVNYNKIYNSTISIKIGDISLTNCEVDNESIHDLTCYCEFNESYNKKTLNLIFNNEKTDYSITIQTPPEFSIIDYLDEDEYYVSSFHQYIYFAVYSSYKMNEHSFVLVPKNSEHKNITLFSCTYNGIGLDYGKCLGILDTVGVYDVYIDNVVYEDPIKVYPERTTINIVKTIEPKVLNLSSSEVTFTLEVDFVANLNLMNFTLIDEYNPKVFFDLKKCIQIDGTIDKITCVGKINYAGYYNVYLNGVFQKDDDLYVSVNNNSTLARAIAIIPREIKFNSSSTIEKITIVVDSLVGISSKKITLKGISSHGLQWYSDILTYNNLKNLKETWKINVFRIAMYTDENGYIAKKEETKNNLIKIVNDLIDLDMYVIIDWHILSDNNPNIYKEDSKAFFEEISTLYKDTPNVIYEICNEPNGDSITWDNDVKPYAEEIIPIIRKNSPNSLIIVGTPNWCQKLKPSVQNPLNYKNILYSCHFYAGTHKQELRDEVSYALENGLPVIISEWGTTDASGNGQVDVDESKTWIDFLKRNNISFINWSFSNKNESSALLKSDFNNQKDFNSYLTESGNLVKSLLKSN